jgi:hypothetical protein
LSIYSAVVLRCVLRVFVWSEKEGEGVGRVEAGGHQERVAAEREVTKDVGDDGAGGHTEAQDGFPRGGEEEEAEEGVEEEGGGGGGGEGGEEVGGPTGETGEVGDGGDVDK